MVTSCLDQSLVMLYLLSLLASVMPWPFRSCTGSPWSIVGVGEVWGGIWICGVWERDWDVDMRRRKGGKGVKNGKQKLQGKGGSQVGQPLFGGA